MTRSEKINLAATVGGPIFIAAVIGWASWSIETALTVRFDAEDKYNATTYATQSDFSKFQAETNRKLDSISSDVEFIKGKLSVNPK